MISGEFSRTRCNDHDIAKVLADPSRAFDVAARVAKRAVRVELPVLDDERNLVGSAGNADRIGFRASVELIAHDIRRSESSENVESCRAQAVIVEPEERSRHLRC